MSPDFFDRFSRGTTVCHRLPATWKLGLTLTVILIAVSLPFAQWPIHGCLLCLVFVAHSLARIPVGYLARRVAWLLPFIIGLAASVALSHSQTPLSPLGGEGPGVRGERSPAPAAPNFSPPVPPIVTDKDTLVVSGGDTLAIAGAIIVRSLISFLAALWLVHVTPFDELLATLRRCHVPALLVSLMSFLYRYSFVLLDELDKMRTARQARSFGAADWRSRWKTNAQLMGQLLIRAMNRGERVHGAMCARGWSGDAKYVRIRFENRSSSP
ncbi:MAG: cobalt ECF transporter T component CbiQ [Planctomycetales bacterium]|nr:cobalt ECF transporter T component CbiQ [Planctomycetales bacterium]